MTEEERPFLLRRLWLRLVATAGIVLAVLLSWWMRIEDAQTPEQIPVAAFGTPVEMGRSQLTPESLTVRQRAGEPDQIVLTAMIENLTGSTQGAFFGEPSHPPLLSIAGVEMEQPDIMLLRDDARLVDLQPRIPEKVELIWTLDTPWKPQEVKLAFERQIFKLRDNLYGKSSWLGFVPAAQMTVTPGAS